MRNPPPFSFFRFPSFRVLSATALVPIAFLHAGYSYGENKTLAYFRLIVSPPPSRPPSAPRSPSILGSFIAPSFILFRFTVLPQRYYTRFSVLILVLVHATSLYPVVLSFCASSRYTSINYGAFSSLITNIVTLKYNTYYVFYQERSESRFLCSP